MSHRKAREKNCHRNKCSAGIWCVAASIPFPFVVEQCTTTEKPKIDFPRNQNTNKTQQQQQHQRQKTTANTTNIKNWIYVMIWVAFIESIFLVSLISIESRHDSKARDVLMQLDAHSRTAFMTAVWAKCGKKRVRMQRSVRQCRRKDVHQNPSALPINEGIKIRSKEPFINCSYR